MVLIPSLRAPVTHVAISETSSGVALSPTNTWVDDRESPELDAHGYPSKGFRVMALRGRDWKYVHYPGRPWGELYDLRHDPDEFDNLWNDPARRRSERIQKSPHALVNARLAGHATPVSWFAKMRRECTALLTPSSMSSYAPARDPWWRGPSL